MLFFLTFLSNPNPFSFTVLSRACPKSSSSNIATTFNVDFLDYYIDFLGYLQDRKARYEQSSDKRAFSLRETLVLRSRRTRTNLSHFHICSQIGQGGYGQVFLAKKRDTGEVCAVKQMSKAVLEQKGEINHILTERQILAVASSSPWLVKLLYAFQSIDHVYLAMEFVPGGDFRTLLVSSGVLKEPYAKLYFAEMSMAVFELHKLGFIHRDLKPENFLLDSQGHIKLTDFGLSRGSLSSNALQGLRKRLDKIKNAPFVCSADRFPRTLRRELRAFSLVGSPDYSNLV
jgi:cell cycle protein kinase DBF2